MAAKEQASPHIHAPTVKDKDGEQSVHPTLPKYNTKYPEAFSVRSPGWKKRACSISVHIPTKVGFTTTGKRKNEEGAGATSGLRISKERRCLGDADLKSDKMVEACP